MRKHLVIWILFPLSVFCLQGCAALLIGTAGVIGGVAISEDTVQTAVDAGFNHTWDTALNELEKMDAEITLEDRSRGLIEAKIRSSSVRIHIDPITDKTIRIHVKARKRYLPHIKLAHEISSRIIKEL